MSTITKIQLELSEEDFRFLLKESKRLKVSIDAVVHHIMLAYFKHCYSAPKILKPVAEVFSAAKLSQFATLQTWLRWCRRRKVPAIKKGGQWHTSVAAIEWFIWSCGNEPFKKHYPEPPKPSWWTAKSSS